MRRSVVTAGSALALSAALLTGCSSTTDTAADTATAEQSAGAAVVDPAAFQQAIDNGAEVIDVRTPAEYAEGHLDGAVNIDIQDQALFEAAIADLDPDAAYVVYCRSGNRSAAATAQMTAAGFTDVTDAGGLQAASAATGLEIVTD